MDKTFHFLSGLPRSGSTALTALLKQNPRFHVSTISPVIKYVREMTTVIDNCPFYRNEPKPEIARKLISDILPTWHSDTDKPVVFDKNRIWPGYYPQIKEVWGIENPKIICCVRDVSEVLASFLRLIHKNQHQYVDNGVLNFVDENIIQHGFGPLNDETRCAWLMQETQAVGEPLESLNAALQLKFPIHIVEYNDFCDDPENVMQGIYEYLGEEWFDHDYNNLDQSTILDNDSSIGLPGTHAIRKKISRTSGSPNDVLPKSIQESLKGIEFWRKSDTTN